MDHDHLLLPQDITVDPLERGRHLLGRLAPWAGVRRKAPPPPSGEGSVRVSGACMLCA